MTMFAALSAIGAATPALSSAALSAAGAATPLLDVPALSAAGAATPTLVAAAPTTLAPGSISGLGPTASVAAAVIAITFTVAAVAKIRRPATAELDRLGLSRPRLLAAALPTVELLVVVLLLVRPRLGSAAALGLLTFFSVFLARAVTAGLDLSCGCFGSTGSRRVTWATVTRNLVLMVLAALGLAGPTWTVPDPAAVAVVAGITLIGMLGVQMFDLRLSMGRLWSVQLAGEPGGLSTRRNRS